MPGSFSFPLGVTLTVLDICDTSYFDAAPVLSPDNQIYYTDQGTLAVAATYLKDFITRTTTNVCGTYTIDVEYNSVTSSIVSGSVDPLLTYLVATNPNNLEFSSN